MAILRDILCQICLLNEKNFNTLTYEVLISLQGSEKCLFSYANFVKLKYIFNSMKVENKKEGHCSFAKI